MFHGEPDDLKEKQEKLNIKGLPEEYINPPDIEVEPECVETVRMFQRVISQWRMGPKGPTGLDLNVVLSIATLQEMGRAEQLQMIDDLAIMEATWLNEWHGRTD